MARKIVITNSDIRKIQRDARNGRSVKEIHEHTGYAEHLIRRYTISERAAAKKEALAAR